MNLELDKYGQSLDNLIFEMRGHKVMLDSDLAELYGVTTKRLNEQMKRNQGRFPEDFVFQLSSEEFQNLRSQFATSKILNRRYKPYVFTEHGAVMLASVLNSGLAMKVSVEVVRAFVRFRGFLNGNQQIVEKLNYLEFKISEHDQQLKDVFNILKELLTPPAIPKRPVGFQVDSSEMTLIRKGGQIKPRTRQYSKGV